MLKKLLHSGVLVLLLCLLLTVSVSAADTDAKYSITITPAHESNVVTIKLEDINLTGFSKAEARLGDNGDWQDFTDNLRSHGWAQMEISDSGTVYVAVTDNQGTAHIKSQYVECSAPKAPAADKPADPKPESVEIIPVQSPEIEEPTQSENEPSPPAEPNLSDKSGVTPTDGSGTVIENSVKAPGEREFFTISTEKGGEYYIVVDKEKSDKNVYLLAEVTEENLEGLTKPSTAEPPEPAPPVISPAPEPPPADEQPAVPQAPEKSSSAGSVVLIIIVVIVCGGAAYYFKIIRPKQNTADPYDDDNDYGDDPEPDEDAEYDLDGDEREE